MQYILLTFKGYIRHIDCSVSYLAVSIQIDTGLSYRNYATSRNYQFSINQSINQIYLPGKYYKNKKKKRYTKSTIRHFPGGKYKLTEVVFK